MLIFHALDKSSAKTTVRVQWVRPSWWLSERKNGWSGKRGGLGGGGQCLGTLRQLNRGMLHADRQTLHTGAHVSQPANFSPFIFPLQLFCPPKVPNTAHVPNAGTNRANHRRWVREKYHAMSADWE